MVARTFVRLTLSIVTSCAMVCSTAAVAQVPGKAKGKTKNDSAPEATMQTDFAGPSAVLVAASRVAWCSAISPNDSRVVTVYGQNVGDRGRVRAWDLKTGQVAWEVVEGRGVRAVAMSPDGSLVATGNYLGEIKILDAATGKLVKAIGDSGVNIERVVFAADGKYVAASGYRGGRIIRLWNIETGQVAKSFDGHTSAAYSVEFSPDGKQLVTASRDTTVRTWSMDDGGVLQILQHPAEAVAATYVAGGRQIATLCTDGGLRVFDANTGELVISKEGNMRSAAPAALTASHDGKLLAAGDGTSVQLWDTTNWELQTPVELGRTVAQGLAFTSDDKRLVASGNDGVVRVLDVKTRQQTQEFVPPVEEQRGAGLVAELAISPDGKLLAVASGELKLELCDAATGKVIQALATRAPARSVAFSPDGKSIASAARGAIEIFATASGERQAILEGHAAGLAAVSWSPDGKLLASGGDDSRVTLWDVHKASSVGVLEGHTSSLTAVTFTPDGTRLVTSSQDASARVWDIATRQSLSVLRGHASAVQTVAVSTDGALIATGSADGTARLWDAATFRPRSVLNNQVPLRRVMFAPQGDVIVTGGDFGGIRLFSTANGIQKRRLAEHGAAVTGLAFLPDGSGLLSGSLDASIRLWKATEPAPGPLVHLAAHRPEVLGASYSPDGKWLVTTGADRMVTLRDPTNGSIRRVFRGHTNRVYRAFFSGDSKTMASASGDGTVKVWSVAKGEMLASLVAWREKVAAARGVAISRDGKIVATGADDGTIKVWDVGKQEEIHVLEPQDLPVTALVFTPDGQTLISATGDWQNFSVPGALKLWEVSSGKEIANLEGPTSEIKSLAIDAEGKWLAGGGSNRLVLLWDLASRKSVGSIRIDSAAAAVTFSPDGRKLAVSGNLGDVSEWEIPSAKLIRRHAGHAKSVSGVSYHPDGKLLATAGHDGYLSLWNVDDERSDDSPQQ